MNLLLLVALGITFIILYYIWKTHQGQDIGEDMNYAQACLWDIWLINQNDAETQCPYYCGLLPSDDGSGWDWTGTWDGHSSGCFSSNDGQYHSVCGCQSVMRCQQNSDCPTTQNCASGGYCAETSCLSDCAADIAGCRAGCRGAPPSSKPSCYTGCYTQQTICVDDCEDNANN